MIGEEDRVQFAAFGDPGQFEVVVDVGDARQPGLRKPPGRFMLTDVAEKGVEAQYSCAAAILGGSSARCRGAYPIPDRQPRSRNSFDQRNSSSFSRAARRCR